MAGEIAVKIHDSLLVNQWVTNNYELTPIGRDFLTSLGVCCDADTSSRRKFACSCLDWNERRFHLGGFQLRIKQIKQSVVYLIICDEMGF
ncbi:hypothetical protein PSI14_10555 [Xenorhabdus sp. XENO-2]|uniref:Transcriptional regulator n=1 Tax=Xenorhabdus anantnagensis TaxID=3025875 RepID=A0ABT5LS69_9GAMM|nr:hypothetical protein [Xenorhabdus anantnagensis]MDC9597279.1 hypothetical protein [Xenorhabdus anantnagensis]